ncbi:MAG: type III glutamate--ammonia ligase [Methylophilus sp.]|nr:type III glutamate--ammonia ligase [Methylophilus sp.]
MKSLAEAQQFLKEHQIKYVLAQFADIHGAAKVKSVPVAHLEDVLTAGAGFAGGAIWGTGIAPNGPDYMAVGDLSTLSLIPWQSGYARLVCDGHVNGKPYEYDVRVVLKKQLATMTEKGWTFYTGLEPEFSLLKRDEHGALKPFDDSDLLQKPCYDYKGITRQSAFLEKLTESLLAVEMDVYQIDHEDSNGQFEVNYTYTDALKSADNYILLKMGASEIANQMGMICSFMPKPFSNRPGNGMHMHMSIGDATNSNIFMDKTDKNGLGLSKLAYHFLAGILEHAPALAAVCAPSVNSYKRLVVGRSLSGATWAPAYIAYGDNNRSTLVRIPYGRLELRLPDGSCNPYLATAAVIAAGMDGVKRELDPGQPRSENLYDYSLEEIAQQGIGILPQNLGDAITALEKDQVICQALGDKLAKEFIALKRMEWVDYSRHVSDWEVNRYVEFF